MPKKKISGLGAVDRSIKSARTQLAKLKKKDSDAKKLKKKQATLAQLKRQLSSKKGRKRR